MCNIKVAWPELHSVMHFVVGKCNSDHATFIYNKNLVDSIVYEEGIPVDFSMG